MGMCVSPETRTFLMGQFAHVRWLPSFLLSGVALGDVTFSCLVDWPRGAALFAQTSLPFAQGSLAPGGFLHVLCTETVLIDGQVRPTKEKC